MNRDSFDQAIRAAVSDFVPSSNKSKAFSYRTSVEALCGQLVAGFVWSVEPKTSPAGDLTANAEIFDSKPELLALMEAERVKYTPGALEQMYESTLVENANRNPRVVLTPAGQTLGSSKVWHYRSKCVVCSGYHETACHHCQGGRARCSSCNTVGRVNCSSCGGPGTIQRQFTRNGQVSYEYHTCYGCNGSGSQTCSSCNGSGRCTCRQCGGAGFNTCHACKRGYQVVKIGYELAYQPAIKFDRVLSDLPSALDVTTFGAASKESDEPLKLKFPVTAHRALVSFDMYGSRFEHAFWGQNGTPENLCRLQQTAFDALLVWLSNPLDKEKVKVAKSAPIIKSLIAQTRAGVRASDFKQVALGVITQSQALQFESNMQAIGASYGVAQKVFEALAGFLNSPSPFADADRERVEGSTIVATKQSAHAPKAPARPAGLVQRLWQGRDSTAKLFWLYGIIGSHLGLLLVQLAGQVDKRLTLLTATLLIGYMFVVTVGIWRSASTRNSSSPVVMRMLGRLGSVVLGLLLLSTVAALL
jgi:hypothetical protein